MSAVRSSKFSFLETFSNLGLVVVAAALSWPQPTVAPWATIAICAHVTTDMLQHGGRRATARRNSTGSLWGALTA